jgi:hypothetical protein
MSEKVPFSTKGQILCHTFVTKLQADFKILDLDFRYTSPRRSVWKMTEFVEYGNIFAVRLSSACQEYHTPCKKSQRLIYMFEKSDCLSNVPFHGK